MKKIIAVVAAVAIMFSSFEYVAYAENKSIASNVEQRINQPTGDGKYAENIELFDESEISDDQIELMTYSTYWCDRKVTVHGSKTAYFYRSPEATKVTDTGWDKYVSETTCWVLGYIESTTVGRRYIADITCGGGTSKGQLIRYYIPASLVTVVDTYHTLGSAASAHPHRRYCDCGYSKTTTASNCYTCYPGYIYYYANGGSGAPGTQTVTASSPYISSTLPTRFKYRFEGWSTSSTATSAMYTPGNSISVSAGSSKSLYAVWEKYEILEGNYDAASAYIGVGGTAAYYEFTPSESAVYVFESGSDGDTYGAIYHADGTLIASDDDAGEGVNFKLSCQLEKGTTYYYGVKWYSTSKTGNIPVEINRQYDISYDANGGQGAPASQTKLHGQSMMLSTVTPSRDLWKFAGWANSRTATTAQYQAGEIFYEQGDQTLYAVWAYPTGSCGTNAAWTFRDHQLYITGTGNMDEYLSANGVPWNAYSNAIEKIYIDEGITSIGNYAFYACNQVTEIDIPDSVTDIGEYAFWGCTALTAVQIPEGVTAIESNTFDGCSGLAELKMPGTITTIGARAFSGCSNLADVEIAHGVTFIGEYAFAGCSSITEMSIPNSVSEIQKAAFSNCTSLRTVVIPDSVSTIGTSVFAYVSENITVKCYLDTAAHKYAIDNDLNYEIMSWGTLENITFTKTAISGGLQVGIIAPKGTVYYTTDGTDPTINSAVYTSPIIAKKNMTIKAISVAEGWEDSAIAEFYTDIKKVTTPYANVESGKVIEGTKIALYCETADVQIYCTTDGNIPTEADLYKEPIEITENTTIYAYAAKAGMLNSTLAVFNYELSNAEDTPFVTTLDAKDITETSAKLSASIDDKKGVIRLVEFVYYEKNNSKAKYTIEANESYQAVITGLTPDTEYWYQARAINELGWSMGYVESFKTNAQGAIMPASIEISPGYVSAKLGQKKTLLATVLPAVADNREVYWSSEDPSVATVDENGVVKAVGLGNTRIKATTVANRLVAYCNIDVISSDVKGEFNFSEHNMITNSSNYDEYGFDHGVNAGGNALMASAYLARWDGAVLEENDPYPDSLASVKYREKDAEYHVQNIMYLPYRTDDLDNDEIKNAIMKYGPVYTSFQVNWDQFDQSKTNFYFPKNVKVTNGGHAIVIVGWDDNYSRRNFVTTPPGDGAFICKNSWGTESGDKGYFYISYYDKYLARAECNDYNAVFYDIESVDNYNKIYQYDYLGPVAAKKDWGQRSLYTANVFPESGSTLQSKELLKAVSFYNYAPGMSYEVYIVTNYQGKDSLKKLGSPVKTGVSEYAGYMTIDLDKPVELSVGTRFAVVVKTDANSDTASIFVELPTKLGDGRSHSSNAKANKDESYIGMDKKTWMDLTDFLPNANLCIKAFSETDDNAVMLQAIDNIGREYEDDTILSVDEWEEKGISFNNAFVQYYENDEVELFENAELSLGAAPPTVLPDLQTNHHYSEGTVLPPRYDLRDEGCMTSVKNQGEIGSCWSFATYASLESSIKKASFSSTSTSSDGLSQAGGDASSIILDTTGTILALGNKMQLTATVLPYDSTAKLVWSSSDPKVVSITSGGLMTALSVGQAAVTVSTTDGKASAKCAITVTTPVSVDSITIHNVESQILAGEKLLLEYDVYPENAGNQQIIWEVDDSSVASVNEYGVLTGKGSGVVTVTAYSADKKVSDTFTVNVDDGFECNIEITENNLGIYDTNIFGSVSVNVKNKTSESMKGTVVMAIYDSQGKTMKVLAEDKELLAGNNTLEFKNVYISDLKDQEYKVEIFVWDNTGLLKPLAHSKEGMLKEV